MLTREKGQLTINAGGKLLDFSEPRLMGILNLTPDSFYAGSRVSTNDLLHRSERMLEEGASMLDLGAVSTRPGAKTPSPGEEEERLLPALSAIRAAFPEAILSVDSFRRAVLEKCLDLGADMVNDISAGNLDEGIFDLVTQYRVPYVLMHMQGTPETMQEHPHYSDVTAEVMQFMIAKIKALRSLAVHDVIVDPGFGFGKSVSHNYELLAKLQVFRVLGCPLMVGISRKSMICKVLEVNPGSALNGTTALHMIALLNGANILRIHDVAEAAEAVRLYLAYKEAGGGN